MPRVTGPKEGTIITASFDDKKGKKQFKSKSLFPSLATTKDLVLLSIRGNEYCAGDYLGAIVQQAVTLHQTKLGSTSQGKTTFLVADEIYWHNLKSMESSDEDVANFKQEAVALGDTYLANNLKYFLAALDYTEETFNEAYPNKSIDEKIAIINQLADEQGTKFEIVRWNSWVNQNGSQKKINEMIPFYESEEGLSEPLNQTVSEFATRHSKNGEDAALWSHRSRGYLSEECPSIMWLAADLGYNFVIYPGDVMPAFKATKDFFVAENHVAQIVNGATVKEKCAHNEHCTHVKDPSRLVNWLEVHFKREKDATKSVKMGANQSAFFPTPREDKVNQVRPEPLVLETPLEVGFEEKEEAQPPVIELSFTKKGRVDEDYLAEPYIPTHRDMVISSIYQGVAQALVKEYNLQEDMKQHDPSQPPRIAPISPPTELTQVFEGFTRGVLESKEISYNEKLGILTNVIDKLIDKHKVCSNMMSCS